MTTYDTPARGTRLLLAFLLKPVDLGLVDRLFRGMETHIGAAPVRLD